MASERLQKVMASYGVASRRRCEELIASGAVKVNGRTAELGCKVDMAGDRVEIEGWGRLGASEPEKIYLMLNKPKGFVTTVKDEAGRRTVMEFVKNIRQRIYPIGRLDRDTEGLLLFTNDGGFVQRLLHPSHLVDKVYIADVDSLPGKREIRFLEEGVCLDDGWTAPAKVKILSEGQVELTIHEGRKHQVKRMLAAVGCRVSALKRIRFGPLSLGNLAVGKYRFLSDREVKELTELPQRV